MTYGTAIQIPESPIGEEWAWLTDLSTSYNGTEDRIPLLRYPRRTFTGNYRFTDKDDLRRHLAMMTKRFRTEFLFPLFQYQTKFKARTIVGATVVTVNAKRGNFRVGGQALVMEGAKFEQVEVLDVTDVSIEFTTGLLNSYTTRAFVCPLATVYANNGASITRQNPDHSATSSFTFNERLPTIPFVSPLNDAVVSTFDAMPVVPYVPIGTGFDGSVSTGVQIADYTAIDDFISPWTLEQWAHNLTFKASNYAGSNDFAWWQLFADTIQGSANPFLLPTNRSDLEVVTPANGGGGAVTVKGDLYTQHYWGHDAFARIFIDSDAGRHYAKVTAISSIGGNDRLTFTPALPAGAGWASNQKVGFLLKLRNDNDKISCKHYGLWTEITMAARTVV